MKKKSESFTAEDYKKEIEKQLKQFNATKINDTYNYNPITQQCPETAQEEKTWNPNVKVCKMNGNIVERECPKNMIKEGEYCYLNCEPGYIRANGLCWKQ